MSKYSLFVVSFLFPSIPKWTQIRKSEKSEQERVSLGNRIQCSDSLLFWYCTVHCRSRFHTVLHYLVPLLCRAPVGTEVDTDVLFMILHLIAQQTSTWETYQWETQLPTQQDYLSVEHSDYVIVERHAKSFCVLRWVRKSNLAVGGGNKIILSQTR